MEKPAGNASVVDAWLKAEGTSYEWRMEYKGECRRGSGSGGKNKRQAAITGAADMLGHMTRPAAIHLRTNAQNVALCLQRGLPAEWKRNGWKNSRGRRAQDAEFWEKVEFSRHAIRTEYIKGMEVPHGNE